MSMTIRNRYQDQFSFPTRKGLFNTANGSFSPSEIKPRVVKEWQKTASEGHPGPYNRYEGRDTGGEFNTRRLYCDAKSPTEFARFHYDELAFSTVRRQADFTYLPAGSFTDTSSTQFLSMFPDYSSPDSKLEALGTTAISRCKPTKSVADLSVALAELLREGLPSMVGASFWKDRTKAAKGLGSEYLNYQFGWKPLVSEIQKTAAALSKHEKIIAQFERDSGKLVRRRYDFPTEHRHIKSERTDNVFIDSFVPASDQTAGTKLLDVTLEQRRWFSGAFTYYLPTGSSSWDGFRRSLLEADKLLGVNLDPETLWNLAPWSWAADWIFNTGDVISNISDAANYGLVMPYGYMMEHTIVKYKYTVSGASVKGHPSRVHTQTLVDETKKRVKASPFGFGLTWEEFDSYQLSILAALGMTRR